MSSSEESGDFLAASFSKNPLEVLQFLKRLRHRRLDAVNPNRATIINETACMEAKDGGITQGMT